MNIIKKGIDKITGKNTGQTEEDNAYYPSKNQLVEMTQMMMRPTRGQSIKPGHIARTDGFDVDTIISGIEHHIENSKNPSEKKNLENLLSRTLSVSDLTSNIYKRFADNPNSLTNWYGELVEALHNANSILKTPKTKTLSLPIELAQFIRLEYPDIEQKEKDFFNKYIFEKFKLEDDMTYFIKTGTFSSKFQFANAKCSEPREMGDYFIVINNFAMTLGAGQSVDLVVREYIEDVEDNPTIYNGMPLRTEFRAFIDFDTKELIGIVPYWHPIVMKRVLKSGLCASIERDYQTYQKHEDILVREYNEYLPRVRQEINKIIPHVGLTGQYSIDIMKNGEDLYVIDMALMSESALKELL